MTEANNNANSFDSEFNIESWEMDNKETEIEEALANRSSCQFEQVLSQDVSSNERSQTQPQDQKMNWQKVAHKLREYNRKLLKKVFRLEQELADIDNKFTKYVEKSRSSDVLVAQQEKELRKHQEQEARHNGQLADLQAIIDQQEINSANLLDQYERDREQAAQQEAEIKKYQEQAKLYNGQLANLQAIIDQQETNSINLLQQYESAQQQAAQLQRDCALLQEDYNNQVYELTSKDREIKELQNKFNQQQRSALQYKAELQRYQEKVASSAAIPNIPAKEPVIPKRKSYSSQRTIQPWSTSTVPETKITLPKSKSTSIPAKKVAPSETVKTAAQIATWSASQAQEQMASQGNKTTEQPKSKSSVKGKPKSLAAVDLPTFPRPV